MNLKSLLRSEPDDPLELGRRLGALNLAHARYVRAMAAHTASRKPIEPAVPDKAAVEALALRLLAGDDADACPLLAGENEPGRCLRVIRALTRAVELAQGRSSMLWVERARRERAANMATWREAVRARAMAIAALQGANARTLELANQIRGRADPAAVALPGWNAINRELQQLLGTGDYDEGRRRPDHFNSAAAEYLRACVREGIVTEDELERSRKDGKK